MNRATITGMGRIKRGEERTCAECGTLFYRSASKLRAKAGKWCSRQCAGTARKTGTERICALCDKTFYRRPNELAGRPSLWCSRACADVGRKRGVQKTCVACSANFYVPPCNLGEGRRTNEFCSAACYAGPHRSVRMKGVGLGRKLTATERSRLLGRNHFTRVVVRICEHCGGEYRRRGKNAHSGLRFCGTACWYEWMRVAPERSPTWRGGYEPYYGPNWPKQSRHARERDSYRCQSCGVTPKDSTLEVHHIRAFRSFEGDWKSANVLPNLVTLCKRCHARDGGKHFAFRLSFAHL